MSNTENKPNAARFQKGSGCFQCGDCGKMTRAVGDRDAESCRLCVDCYDRCGNENYCADHCFDGIHVEGCQIGWPA